MSKGDKLEGVSTEFGSGILEIVSDEQKRVAFLRVDQFRPSPKDIYVSNSQIRLGLRNGDLVEGPVRQAREKEKYPSLLRVEKVNGLDLKTARNRPVFDRLLAVAPKAIGLDRNFGDLSPSIVEQIINIRFGQFGLIIAPMKSGAPELLREIANKISEKHPEIHVIFHVVSGSPTTISEANYSVNTQVVSSKSADAYSDPICQDHFSSNLRWTTRHNTGLL